MNRFLILAVIAAVVVAAPWALFKKLNAPVSPASAAITVEIKPGMRIQQVAEMVKNAGIIRSAELFSLLAKITGKADRIKAGEYELDPSRTASATLDKLVEGKMKLHHLTVPEGYTLAQIAQAAAKEGFCAEKEFLEAAGNQTLLAEYRIKGKNAEGYLLPETYHFRKNAGADAIVRKMLATFAKKTAPVREKYEAGSDLEFGDVVTLASIIEKEAAGPEEYPMISAVFHNRLRLGMPLQADPTVIYAIPSFDGNIRKKDLEIDSPYNTYRYRGLPPGPIANPGLASLEAAYNPHSGGGYLYFVAMGSQKKHYFSTTLREHNEAVRKYQLGGRGSAAHRTGAG